MQYLIRLSNLLHAFQDQENIIVLFTFSWGEKLFCPYFYNHEDIREFERNNPLECCYEVRIAKQTVHANNVYSGKEIQKIYISPACKLSELQVSGLPSPNS